MFAVLSADDAVSVQSQAITFIAVGGFFAFITLWYNTRSKRKDTALAFKAEAEKEARQEARLDRVEAQAREAAMLLEKSNRETAEAAALHMAKLDVLERHQTRIEASQDIVHAMLNSAETTRMLAYIVTLKSNRASQRTQHSQLRELFALRPGGDVLTVEQKNELDALSEAIQLLTLEIAATQDAVDDRVRAQELEESKERNKTKLADAAEAVAEAAAQPIVIDRASITVGRGEVEAAEAAAEADQAFPPSNHQPSTEGPDHASRPNP